MIIDDELAVVQGCSRTLLKDGYSVETALTPSEAITKIEQSEAEYDVMFIDLKLIGDPKTDLLKRLKELSPETAIVFIVGPASIAAAVEAMKPGGHEYLPKPFTPDDLHAVMSRALQLRAVLLQARDVRKVKSVGDFDELIWMGPAIQKIFRLISLISARGTNVLIIGAPGTGKRRVAMTIHDASPRKLEPFVMFEPIRAESPTISEQLFGYVAREFSSSTYFPGKMEEAGNGTFYIPEITVLATNDQTRLLSAIKERRNMPLRGINSRPLSCRIILGTERNLQSAVRQGKLLESFYRDLEFFPIYLPSLFERSEDIPALVYRILRRFAKRYNRPVSKVEGNLMTKLQHRHWHKNIRELSQCVERMVSVCESDTVDLMHYQQVMGDVQSSVWSGLPPSTVNELKSVKKRLRHAAVTEVEKAFVTEALRRSNGNVTRAAREVGMQRRNFQTMMKQYEIKQ
ncbi:MAG: sigma 54-interacting transcriptional regulator [Candidatus Hatepunaea meridiana]|nr:sigma 54-interacting transcriptional regulator [Candidatus Hatepunaea meridiana]